MLSTARNAASSDSNSTRIVTGEEDDESSSNITLEEFKEEFKERYRRLIPYMTFYVAHNFVNDRQPPISQGASANDAQQVIPLVRKNQQANPQFARTYTGPRRENNYRASARNQEKFVPSVQYDPRNVGVDNDYFTPVRYNSEKINYEYDSTPYQDQKIAYPEIPMVTNAQNSRKENRYYGNARPLRPYTSNGREHPTRKQPSKPVHGGDLRDDYVLDYNVRATGSNAPINYPIKDFQDHRQVPVYPNTLELIPGLKQPSLLPQLPRNPNVNLEQIMESFQLSERLPESLNNDNIDNSLRTLVEILNILHNTKKEEFPQIQAPPLTPARPPLMPQKNAAKVRPHTRPKVITESRFQATPNPIYLTDDPERYKATSYEEEGRPKGSPRPGYNANSLTNNVVEYYIPVVQEIPTRYKETFIPTIRPQPDEPPIDHSYAITEDIREDILQKEQFPFLTTESPTLYTYHTEPDKQSVPQTRLKYGATRGKANVDYPAYSSIPRTNFSCKEQRYKGFFGDPETGCQVICFSVFPIC